MERNLDRRVETLCPILDADHVRRIRDVVLNAYLGDTDRAYILGNGGYAPASVPPGTSRVSAQDTLLASYTAAPRALDES